MEDKDQNKQMEKGNLANTDMTRNRRKHQQHHHHHQHNNHQQQQHPSPPQKEMRKYFVYQAGYHTKNEYLENKK